VDIEIMRVKLESLYCRYNQRRFIHPDPLEFLYNYDDLRDREIVGLIASSLAYGRVGQILKYISTILDRLRPSPYIFIKEASQKSINQMFKNFRYRFTTGKDISLMLLGIKQVIKRYGSLEACFKKGIREARVRGLIFFYGGW